MTIEMNMISRKNRILGDILCRLRSVFECRRNMSARSYNNIVRIVRSQSDGRTDKAYYTTHVGYDNDRFPPCDNINGIEKGCFIMI